MENTNVHNTKLFDKRQRKPLLINVKEGDLIFTLNYTEEHVLKGRTVQFYSPHISGIFLNTSQKALRDAKKLYDELNESLKMSEPAVFLSAQETILVYDYLEVIQNAIITLYAAIESTINALIPNNFSMEIKNQRGAKEIWDKSYIERWLTTIDKLKKVLPQALKIPSPANYTCWSKFNELNILRNDIIHSKSNTVLNCNPDEKIIGKLLSENVFSLIDAGRALIKELHKALPTHSEFPILYPEETLTPIEIETKAEFQRQYTPYKPSKV